METELVDGGECPSLNRGPRSIEHENRMKASAVSRDRSGETVDENAKKPENLQNNEKYEA